MGLLKGLLLRLRPAGIDELGLAECLRSLVTNWNGSSGGRTRFDLDIRGDISGLPEAISVSVFRIIQECLTNVAKHAGASEVNIRVERALPETRGEFTADNVDVVVEDNGLAGRAAGAPQPGIGLSGMRERVAALGGMLTLTPRPNSGLKVRALIPVHSAARAT